MNTLKGLAVAILATVGAGAVTAQSVTVKGSDTMLPLGQGWAAGYMKAHAGSTISVTGGGSTTGIAGLINGTCDIAQASRTIKGSEVDKAKARGFVPFEIPVARDGLSIVVNPKNPVARLSIAQLRSIYSGAVSNWQALGGPNRPIVVVGRDSSSGTYGFFQDTVLGIGRPYRPDMQTTPSNNAIAQIVSQDEGAIGYIGAAYADAFGKKLKVLPISGGGAALEPTVENVRSGKYPLSRYLFFYTHGRPSGSTKTFIDWVRGAEGQEIVEKVGYFAVR